MMILSCFGVGISINVQRQKLDLFAKNTRFELAGIHELRKVGPPLPRLLIHTIRGLVEDMIEFTVHIPG
jgi:hypothetical protein